MSQADPTRQLLAPLHGVAVIRRTSGGAATLFVDALSAERYAVGMAKVPDFVLEMLQSDPLMQGRELRVADSSIFLGLPEENLTEDVSETMPDDEKELWNLRQVLGLLLSQHHIAPTSDQRSYIALAGVVSLRKLCNYLYEHHSWPEEWLPA